MGFVFGYVVMWVPHVVTPSRQIQKGEKNQIPCKVKIQHSNRQRPLWKIIKWPLHL